MKLQGRQNRKGRRASGVYKVEPLFQDDEKDALTVDGKRYYIDGKLGEYLVVSVPVTTSNASAIDLQRKLGDLAKKPVLIVTHNMAFLRATLLTGKERTTLAEIVEKAIESKEPASANPVE